jgi:uncharacterized membrane protein YgcG
MYSLHNTSAIFDKGPCRCILLDLRSLRNGRNNSTFTTSKHALYLRPHRSLHQRQVVITSAQNNTNSNNNGLPPDNKQRAIDETIILTISVLLSASIIFCFRLGIPLLSEADDWSGLDAFGSTFAAGDIFAALLWSASLYFASPYQQLLLFLGKIETERPSDSVMDFLGRLTGKNLDAVDYEPSIALKATTIIFFIASGCLVSFGLEATLGDASWAVSTGIGSAIVAGVYEAGRPDRLSPAQLQVLELQWQDFKPWADTNLRKKSGRRCHESEVFKSFRNGNPKYRSEEVLNDDYMRDMIRNWYPEVERTRSGYLKNVGITIGGGSDTGRSGNRSRGSFDSGDESSSDDSGSSGGNYNKDKKNMNTPQIL